MKLLRRLLLVVMSFGVIFSSTFLLNAFATGAEGASEVGALKIVPTNLDECCQELDKILVDKSDVKDEIRKSSVYDINSYLFKLNRSELGAMIRREWLASHKDKRTGRAQRSVLCELLYDHGADDVYAMSGIILENYSHYLLTGASVANIEDLVVDHSFNYWHHFNPDLRREETASAVRKQVEYIAACKNETGLGGLVRWLFGRRF